ncbi:MAG: DUF1460 domain-containing protein [Bacteroidetes bacterium]|nr:DUF1460 domain-containing protein [Bacteroidota bacterium]
MALALRALVVCIPTLLLALGGLTVCQAEADGAAPRLASPDTATVVDDEASRAAFAEVMARAQREAWHQRTFGALVQQVGLSFRQAPYAAGLLDTELEERLVVDLRQFDCVTFVEIALAMARGIAAEDYTYATFTAHLEDQRYRDGRIDGYCSRLHYFTDWIYDNAQRGTVVDLTQQLGGVPMAQPPTFMSAHRSAYRQLAASDSLYAELLQVEQSIAAQPRYFIPQDRIRDVYNALQAGDIIALATDIDGLDVSHTGLVYRGPEGSVGLLHASLEDGVKVSLDLQRYVQNNRHQTGIVVARPTGR